MAKTNNNNASENARKLAEELAAIAGTSDQVTRITRDIEKIYEKIGLSAERTAQYTKDLAEAIFTGKANAQKLAAQLRKNQFVSEKTRKIQEEAAQEMIDGLYRQTNLYQRLNSRLKQHLKMFTNLPVIGKAFADAIDDVSLNMTKTLLQAGDIEAKIGMWARANSAMLLGLGLLLTAFLAVAGVLDRIIKSSQRLSEEIGYSIAQTQELVKRSFSLQKSQDTILAYQEDILAVSGALVSAYGNFELLSGRTAANVAEIAKSYGLNFDASARTLAVLEQITGATTEYATGILQGTAGLAEAAGVAPGKVIEDIANNAEVAAKFFGENPKALARAAVEASRLGLSLERIASVAEQILDIETSLTKQFEASALVGEQINLDRARLLALNGDIAGATSAIIDQVQSLTDYERLNFIQKRAIADAAGLEVAELERAIVLRSKTNNLTRAQQTMLQESGLTLAEITSMNQKDLEVRARQLQSTEQLRASLDKILSSLVTIMLPVMNAVASVISFIASHISLMVGGITALTVAFVLLKRQAIGAAIASIWKTATQSFAGVPIAGIALAAGAAVAAISQMTSQIRNADDIAMSPVSPASGRSRVLMGPEGAFALNDRDSIIAGTDLNSGNSNTNVNVDMKPVVDALDNVADLLRQYLSSPTPAIITGDAVDAIGLSIDRRRTF